MVSALCVAFLVPPVQAQSIAVCDPQLAPPPGDPLGYRLRGVRCEGLYHVQRVSAAGGLTLASFTERTDPFEVPRGQPLVVRWTMPGPAEVRIRGASLRRETFYRMDAAAPAADSIFAWPTDVLVALQLGSRDIGISASIDYPIEDRSVRVYLPIRWGAPPPGPSGLYDAVVIPGTGLDEVFVTLTALTSDREEAEVLLRNEPLGLSVYPAERPIRVRLPPLAGAGIYHLRLAALQRGGGASTTGLYFYHTGVAP